MFFENRSMRPEFVASSALFGSEERERLKIHLPNNSPVRSTATGPA